MGHLFFNQAGEFRAHSIQFATGGSALDIASDMERVASSLGEDKVKIKYLVSDSAAAQLAANKIYCSNHQGTVEIRCALHTCKHLEKHAQEGFSQNPTEVEQQATRKTGMPVSYTGAILRYAKLLFGSRLRENKV